MATVFDGLTPGFIKTGADRLVCLASAPRRRRERAARILVPLRLTIDLPRCAKRRKLPLNDKIRLLAATVSDEGSALVEAQPLYDTLVRR